VTRVRNVIEDKCGELVCIDGRASALDAARHMVEHGVASLVVTNGRGGPVMGILTDRDLVEKVVASEAPAAATGVGDVMTKDVVHVEPDCPLESCMRLFSERRTRHLIVNDGTLVVGIVSLGDVVHVLSRDYAEEVDYLTEYIRGSYPG
jgi:CBS domain-containing protein